MLADGDKQVPLDLTASFLVRGPGFGWECCFSPLPSVPANVSTAVLTVVLNPCIVLGLRGKASVSPHQARGQLWSCPAQPLLN